MSSPRLGIRISIGVICAAVGIVSGILHGHFRQDRLPVVIWWASDTSDVARAANETELGLIEGVRKRDRWTYRLRNYSRDAVEAIVVHPEVRLTEDIDRERLRVTIDAPALPTFVRWLLEKSLGLWISTIAAASVVLVLAASWRDWRKGALRTTEECAPAVTCLLLLLYGVEIVRTAWVADDAAITLRTVLNFINGYGARFNIDERVQAFTHPMWFLLISALSFASGNVFVSTLWLSLICSLATLGLLLQDRRSLVGGVLVTLGLLFSKAYVDFSASGLENPLSHFIVLSTVMAAYRANVDRGEGWLVVSCLGVGAAYLTRPDIVLLVLPLVVFVLVQVHPSRGALLRGLFVGAVPVVAWTTISIFYYGSPFPNPAYAKLGSGIPLLARAIQGGKYFLHSVPRDSLTLVMIALGAVFGLRHRGAEAATAVGILLYLAYTVAIGGDFMEGRFLTCPLLLSSWLLIRARYGAVKLAVLAACLAGLGTLGLRNTLLSPATYEHTEIAADGIADERGYYFQDYGWLNAGDEVFGPQEWKIDPNDVGQVRIVCGGLGFSAVMDGPAVHYIDTCALADPLLARLPGISNAQWRIGHFERALPSGYEESIQTDSNRLSDPRMRAFYDSIRVVTRSRLTDPNRLWEILRLNVGLVRRP